MVPFITKDGLLLIEQWEPTPEEVDKYSKINLTNGHKPWNRNEWDLNKKADDYVQEIDDTVLCSLELISEEDNLIVT